MCFIQSTPSSSLNMFDEDGDNDDGTLRLHVSNIPFTWSKEKLAEVFGVYILEKIDFIYHFHILIEIWNNI